MGAASRRNCSQFFRRSATRRCQGGLLADAVADRISSGNGEHDGEPHRYSLGFRQPDPHRVVDAEPQRLCFCDPEHERVGLCDAELDALADQVSVAIVEQHAIHDGQRVRDTVAQPECIPFATSDDESEPVSNSDAQCDTHPDGIGLSQRYAECERHCNVLELASGNALADPLGVADLFVVSVCDALGFPVWKRLRRGDADGEPEPDGVCHAGAVVQFLAFDDGNGPPHAGRIRQY